MALYSLSPYGSCTTVLGEWGSRGKLTEFG